MNLELVDKVVFVAGSSRGIGRAIARAFLAEGARVVVTGRGYDAVETTAQEFATEFQGDHVTSFVGDLTDPTTIRAALQQVNLLWGAVSVVVANIGSGKSEFGWQIEPSEWARVFQLNFFGTVNLIGEVMPQLIAGGSASVVIIGSIAGIEATSAPLAYASAKAALLNYSKNLARKMAADGVRVNVVAPGNILFPGGSWERHAAANPAKVEDHLQAEVPMKRFGKPEEIADFVVFLSSPRASFATGLCAVVDGGQTRSI